MTAPRVDQLSPVQRMAINNGLRTIAATLRRVANDMREEQPTDPAAFVDAYAEAMEKDAAR